MKRGELQAALRTLETEHDVPARLRMEWLSDALANIEDPRLRVLAKAGLKRLKKSTKRPKHDVLYDLEPLVQLAFGTTPLPQVDRLILQLRLTTLMKSGDTATITWASSSDTQRNPGSAWGPNALPNGAST